MTSFVVLDYLHTFGIDQSQIISQSQFQIRNWPVVLNLAVDCISIDSDRQCRLFIKKTRGGNIGKFTLKIYQL